jgi:uncharacterized membrane protein HdeD (DUF308 family)
MTQERLERIRLLSQRFHELQGLRVALCGAMLALTVGGYLTLAPEPSNNGAVAAMLLSFVLIVPGVLSLNRYYATRFGRQVRNPPRHPGRLLLFGSAYLAVTSFLHARFEAIPAGTPTLVVVAVASIWLAIRDWPWRAHYLLATASVSIGFIASAPVTGALAPNMTVGVLFLLVGASMVPIGLLDHLLLMKLMKESREARAVSAGRG